MQGAAIASGLTRILGGPLTAALEYGTINYVGDSARFSIEFADDSVAPICSIVDAAVFDVDGGLPLVAPPRQALVATLGYNNVEARLLAPVGFSFVAKEDCAATLTPKAGFALAGEVVLEAQFIADGELLRREHTVFLGFSEERTDFFVENVDWIAGLFDGKPFAPLDDADGDGSPNTYDYTPLPGIDLTVRLSVFLSGRENVGDASAPYPIFNIWQLQAIGGTVQGIDGEIGKVYCKRFSERVTLMILDLDITACRSISTPRRLAIGTTARALPQFDSLATYLTAAWTAAAKWFAIYTSTARTKTKSACSALCERRTESVTTSSPTSVCKTRSSSEAIGWERLRDGYTTAVFALRARGRRGALSGAKTLAASSDRSGKIAQFR